MSLLIVEDLSVGYGGIDAVQNVSLRVEAGEIASVIGPNGAGKTTLLGAIMGVLPCRGRVTFDGAAITGVPIEGRVERGLSLVPEKRELFASMSVLENLRLGGFRHRAAGRAEALRRLDECFTLFPRLAERRTQIAGTLSGGERQMLAMARALMAQPALLMLDEPSLGLAPLVVRDIFRTITALRDKGVAILLVEQNARAALAVSNHATVLEMGRVTLAGSAADLAADPRIVEMYLGAVPG
jgi:branched-chain amino acid transport system ATP-binding protein